MILVAITGLMTAGAIGQSAQGQDGTGAQWLPPASANHLALRGYIVDTNAETERVVACAAAKLPSEIRAVLASVIVVGSFDDKRFQKSDPQAQAFVIPGDADHVYVTRWGFAYRAAIKGHETELAGALAHEAWHLKNGPDEAGAYDQQLRILNLLHASPLVVDRTRRAKDNAVYTQAFEKRKRRP
jgi:hypothetical protein